jgi:4-hydroxybenzoate polyprenyltransferase
MGQRGIIPTRPFRADDWWTSKAALLMGFVYLFALWFNIPFRRFIPLSFFSILVIAGFASFGYLINDLFDKEKDRLAGKKNFLLDKPIAYQLGLAILSITLIIVPWFFLPITRVSYVLICTQLSLFLLYSCPPIRLKEKGAAGVLVDGLYAHAIPTILAAYTFFLASSIRLPYSAFALLFFWQLLGGIRNILIHQLEDKNTDMQSKTRTFATSVGAKNILRILQAAIVIELLLCLTFFSLLTVDNHWFGFCIAAVFLLCFQSIFWYIHLTQEDLPEAPLRFFPNNVYEKWLPALYLIMLSFSNKYFVILLFLHITFFNFDLYRRIIRMASHIWNGLPVGYIQYRIIIPIRIFISKVINHTIYYTLLIVGIDLKKEQISALDYFKKKWRNSR